MESFHNVFELKVVECAEGNWNRATKGKFDTGMEYEADHLPLCTAKIKNLWNLDL
jgi:hypothetical protein